MSEGPNPYAHLHYPWLGFGGHPEAVPGGCFVTADTHEYRVVPVRDEGPFRADFRSPGGEWAELPGGPFPTSYLAAAACSVAEGKFQGVTKAPATTAPPPRPMSAAERILARSEHKK